MLKDRNLLRGLFLTGIALLFGIQSAQYKIGELTRAGPGMFPLLVSSLLLLVGLAMIVRSVFVARAPMHYSLRNMGIILASLVGFALVSQFLNMVAGILVLVFCAALASPPYSVMRNMQIAAVLIVVAFAFQRLFGLELNLY